MDTALAKLRPFNLIAALLHLASLAAILILANDASLPVNATYMNGAPGTGAFAEPVTLFNLNIAYMVAAFLALSPLFHLLVISPAFWPRYTAGLRANRNNPVENSRWGVMPQV